MEYVFDFPSDAETSNPLYQQVPDNLLYVHPSSYRAMEIYIHTLYWLNSPVMRIAILGIPSEAGLAP